MADNILKGIIKIEAPNVEKTLGAVQNSFSLLQKSVAAFGGGIRTFIPPSVEALKKLVPAIEPVAPKLNNSAAAAKSASNSFLGINRVLQDLPFGFVAISNNLTELPAQFKALSTAAKESGQTMGGVLLQSLKGSGGIGLAFSAVTAAITFASIGLGSWTLGLFGASKATSEASEEQKKYNEYIKSAFSDVAGEVAKVETLVAAYKSEGTSKKERVNIIKELQSIAPAYFATLNAEKATVGELTGAYNKFSLSIQSSIKSRVLSKQLEDIIKQRLELEKLIKGGQEQVVINGKLVTVQNSYYGTQKDIKGIQDKIANSKLQELKISQQIAGLEPPNITAADFKTPKAKDVSNDLIELAKKIQGIFKVDASIQFSDFDTDAEAKKKAIKTLQQLKTFFSKSSRNLLSVKDLFDFEDIQVPPEQVKQAATSFADMFSKEVAAATGSASGIDNSLVAAISNSKAIDGLKQTFGRYGAGFGDYFGRQFAISAYDNIAKGLKVDKAISSAFVGISVAAQGFQALTDQFSKFVDNVANGESVIKSFGNLATGVIKQVITGFIKAAFSAAILSLITGGAAGGKGGLSFIQALASQFGGFRASGGPVSAGKSYIVGENGPEIFTPNFGGGIIPNNRISGSFAGSGGGRVEFVISGNVLRGILTKANRSALGLE